MIETSKDILYIVISFCVLWATVFLCWMFYYAGKILKNTNQIIEEFRVRLQALADAIGYIQEKVEYLTLAVSSIVKGVGETVKETVIRKAKNWMNSKSENYEGSAKEAVKKAVEKTAEGMNNITRKLKE